MAFVALSFVIVAGVTLASALRSDDDGAPQPRPGSSMLSRGGVSLAIPAHWTVAAPSAVRIPGMASPSLAVLTNDLSRMQLVAGQLPVTTTALLPKELIGSLGSRLPTPERVRLNGRVSAYYYGDLALQSSSERFDVFAIPTTAGVATVACLGVASFEDCSRVANSLRITDGEPLPLRIGVAFRIRLDAVIRTVDAARERSRGLLDAATTPSDQAEATLDVSTAYREAADVLTPLTLQAAQPLEIVRQLDENAAAYRRIAEDLEAQNGDRIGRERRRAVAGETRLKNLLLEQR